MTFFKNTQIIGWTAVRWLMAFVFISLLGLGSAFRVFVHRSLDHANPDLPVFLASLDQYLVLSFWLLLFFAFLGAILFVRSFFQPLGSLVAKAIHIRQGNLNIKASDVIKESRGEWYQLDLYLNQIWKDLKRKKADVAKERGELDAVLTAANDAILAVDRDLKIRYYNAPMALLFEQKEEGHWGRGLTEVIRNQSIVEGVGDALKKKKSQKVEVRHESGSEAGARYFQVSISPFFDEKRSKVRGAVAFFNDITDHKRLDKVRMDFVANASHELKTPLTSIQGYLQLIQSQCSDNQSLVEPFQVVENNIVRLNKIIYDLLELSKIEGAESLGDEPISTMEITESVMMDLQGQAQDKQQTLIFNYECEEVNANRDLLEHVIMNLAGNAIKYSPENSQIKLSWKQDDEFNIFSVKDNGPGIESYHQGRLFERFYRVRDEKAQSTKGTGLGLSIVRNCMEKMNGYVDLKSAPGLGSEFLCYFPKN